MQGGASAPPFFLYAGSMNPEVTHHAGAHTGEFAIDQDGKRVARLTYSREGNRVDLLHTEVDGSLRGTGTGNKLVEAAVEFARAEGVQILPLCSFAKSVFAKTPDYGDVLSK